MDNFSIEFVKGEQLAPLFFVYHLPKIILATLENPKPKQS